MRAILSLVAVCALLSACRDTENKPPLSANVPLGSASAPAFARGEPGVPVAPTPAAEQPAEEEAEADGAPTGEGDPDAEGDEPAAPADSSAPGGGDAPEGPLPVVQIKNVGLHIGGEDNTADQKKPIRTAVMAKYEEMRRCYGKAAEPPKKATFSVDMRIPGEGGAAKVSHPRSGLRGGGVKECLVAVFESVDFPKQPKGPRMVSFSVEFKR